MMNYSGEANCFSSCISILPASMFYQFQETSPEPFSLPSLDLKPISVHNLEHPPEPIYPPQPSADPRARLQEPRSRMNRYKRKMSSYAPVPTATDQVDKSVSSVSSSSDDQERLTEPCNTGDDKQKKNTKQVDFGILDQEKVLKPPSRKQGGYDLIKIWGILQSIWF